MNEDELFELSCDWIDEMLDDTKWAEIIDCKNCGHVPAHSPHCEWKPTFNALYIAGMLGVKR
jgi:hypothetical protein